MTICFVSAAAEPVSSDPPPNDRLTDMKYALVLFAVLTGISAFSQIDSIGKGQLPRIVRWDDPSLTLDTAKTDSSVYMPGFDVRSYNDVYKRDRFHLGNTGSESFEIYPDRSNYYFRDDRFYAPFWLTPGELNYYNATAPFTRALYGIGPNEEQTLKLIHTQNINDRFNIAGGMNTTSGDGFYQNQETGLFSFGLTSNYFSKNGKYVLHAGAGYNNANVRHNNGIVDTRLFTENLQPNRPGTEIFTPNAYMESKNRYFNATQRYKITETRPDSLEPRKFNIYINAETRLSAAGSRYVDDGPSPGAYSVYGLEGNTSWLVSEQHYDFAEQKAGLEFESESFRFSGYYLIHSGNLYFPSGGENLSFNDNAVGGTAELKPLKNFMLSYEVTSYFYGFNAGGINSHFTAVYGADSADLKAEFHYDLDRTRGSVNFYRFYTNGDLFWNNDFDFMNRNYFGGRVSYRDRLGLRAEYWNTGSPIIFGLNGMPEQRDVLRVGRVAADFSLALWRLRLDADVSFNRSFTGDVYRIPDIISKSSLYFESLLFGGKLELKTGVDVFYLSPFKGNTFSPLTRAFHLQDDYENGHMIYPNYFLDIRIHNTKIFVKASNAAAGLLDYNYMPVPGYPMQDMVIRYGVAWDFIN